MTDEEWELVAAGGKWQAIDRERVDAARKRQLSGTLLLYTAAMASIASDTPNLGFWLLFKLKSCSFVSP